MGAHKKGNFDLKLGSVLLRMGVVKKKDLSIALVAAEEDGQRLGEALIHMKLITSEDLVRALRLQKKMFGGRSGCVDAMLEIVEERTQSGAWQSQLLFLKKGGA